jgi:hypothetical protein
MAGSHPRARTTIRSIKIRALAACFLLAITLTACTPTGTISTQPDGLRTFTWYQDVLCNLSRTIPGVAGVLRGEQGAREPVWLEGPTGQHWSVVWPAGFTVAFVPDAELRNENGVRVVGDGGAVTLHQVHRGTGTYDDPFIASGGSSLGCYPV